MVEEIPVSKTVSAIGVSLLFACAILGTGCSDRAGRPAAKVEKKADADHKPADFSLQDAVGRPTPEFSLKDANGQTVHAADYKGKVVLLDFWATWCGPCKIEIPWFMDFERQFKDQGFAVLGVSMDEDGLGRHQALRPGSQDELSRPTRQRSGLHVLRWLGCSATTLLIDRQGEDCIGRVGVSKGERGIQECYRSTARRASRQRSCCCWRRPGLAWKPGSR